MIAVALQSPMWSQLEGCMYFLCTPGVSPATLVYYVQQYNGTVMTCDPVKANFMNCGEGVFFTGSMSISTQLLLKHIVLL